MRKKWYSTFFWGTWNIEEKNIFFPDNLDAKVWECNKSFDFVYICVYVDDNNCVFMLQIILDITRYNSVQLSFTGFYTG